MRFRKVISLLLCFIMLISMSTVVYAGKIDLTSYTSSYTFDEGESITIYIGNEGFLNKYEVLNSSNKVVAVDYYSYRMGSSDPFELSPGKYTVKCTIEGFTYVVSGGQYVARPNGKTSTVTRSLTIRELKDITESISFPSKTVTYDGTEHELTVTEIPTGATVSYESEDANKNKATDPGKYNITAVIRKDGYAPKRVTSTLTIKKRDLVIKARNTDKTYDGKRTIDLSFYMTGKIDGDSVYNLSQWPSLGTFPSSNAGSNLSINITNNYYNFAGDDIDKYNIITPSSLTGNIYPAPLTIKAKDVQMIKGEDYPPLDYEIIEGQLYGSDEITGELSTLATGTQVGEFDITQGSLSVSSNYTLTFLKGNFSVAEKEKQKVIISDIPSEKNYGEDGFKIEVTPDSASGLNDFTFSSSNPDVAEIDNEGNVVLKNAGTTILKVFQEGNEIYAPFTKTQQLVVNKININITADAKSKRVGANDPTLTYTYSGTLVGTDKFTGELTRQSGEEVGTYDILQGTLALSDNYNIIYNKAVFEIVDKTPQNVGVAGIVAEKTYGDDGFKITVTPDENSNLDNFEITSSNTNVATIDDEGNVTIKNAGSTTISVKEPGNADYAPFEKTWTLTVNKVDITVTADTKSKRVGTNDPALTYQYTGNLIGTDVFTGELVRQSGEEVGKYDILQGTLELSDNYNLAYNKGTFEILDKNPQNITVSTVTEKTYGDAPFIVTVTPDAASGLCTFTYESSNTDVAEISNDGTVTIKAAGKTNITVKQAGNTDYSEFVKTQELVVNKVEIVVTADARSKRIGTDDPALTYQYTGNLVGTDAFTGELSRQSGEEIGTYDILQGTLALSENYNITYNKAVFEILEKTPQNIVITDIDTKTYGDSSFAITVTPDATANLSNFTYDSSDNNVATIDEIGNVTIVGAGETIISVTEAGNEDYAKTTVTKKLTVNKKALEIKVDNVTITYGDAINTNITYAGFVNGEDETVLTKAVEVSGYSVKPNVGEYDIVLGGAEAANYEISYVNAKLTVSKKNATVTQLNVFDKVADTTTDATINESSLVIDGMILGDDLTVDFENAAATFATAEVGDNIAVNISGLVLAGEHANNYNLTNAEFATTASIKETITASDIAAQITALTVVKDATAIEMPNVPAGYAITLKSSDNDAVVKDDGSVAPVENDTQVGLVFTVTNEADENDTADTTIINVTVHASSKVVVTVTAEANGTVTGSDEYLKNSDVTVVATANSGYKFSGWYKDGTSVSTNATYTFKAENDIALVAKFSKVSSSGGGGGVSKYTVKFETNGGTAVKSVSVNKNDLATEPIAPTKDGFKFDGWYTDKDLTTAYDFTAKVTKSFTLYAKWTEIEKEPVVDEPDTTITFTDVKENDWFYANVQYVVENKLMNGVAEDKFAPNDTLTRAMLVTVLYRNAGEPAVNKSILFADVDMGSWYANAVVWAKQNGIVNGVNETEFEPDANITREQIAAIMFRYAQYKGMEAVTLEENLHFDDADEISEYAVSAMNWVVGTGLVKGKSATTINPKDNATRAEIAAILQRFIENNK